MVKPELNRLKQTLNHPPGSSHPLTAPIRKFHVFNFLNPIIAKIAFSKLFRTEKDLKGRSFEILSDGEFSIIQQIV